jgi:hypothetical protein
MRICGFSGAHDVSQEHLWAGWLGTVILESRAQGGAKNFHAQIERSGQVSSFQKNDLEMTVGMPCEPCNNGWMSALENEVKDFMTPMVFRGDKTILHADRQRSLIRWVVKTAMVNEFTGRKDEPNPQSRSAARAPEVCPHGGHGVREHPVATRPRRLDRLDQTSVVTMHAPTPGALTIQRP